MAKGRWTGVWVARRRRKRVGSVIITKTMEGVRSCSSIGPRGLLRAGRVRAAGLRG
jgi:hypothetical protein